MEPSPIDPSIAQDQQDFSLEQLVLRHHSALLRFLRNRLGNEDDASDAAQEAYARFMRFGYGSNRPTPDVPEAMLFRIAANVANDKIRRERTHRMNEHDPVHDVQLVAGDPSQERQIAARQDLARLKQAVLGLPTKCRIVFLLSRVQGLSYAQIAERCNISIKMVEKHIGKALAICRTTVGDRDSGAST